MYLIALIVLLLMIVWAVLNWRAEWNYVVAVYRAPIGSVPLWKYVHCVALLAGDIVITSAATGILGLGGLFGACAALFMSNLLSVFFFVPHDSAQTLHSVPARRVLRK